MIKRALLIAVFISMTGFSVNTLANDEHVKHDIALLQDMMVHMLVIIDRVEDRQARIAPHASYYFDTEQIRQDLFLISTGVDNFLSPSRTPARFISPIDGDYLIQR